MFNRIFIITASCMLFFSAARAQGYNYGEVLQKSLFFYECQRSGNLPAGNRVNWRGPSALNDGSDNGTDLTGGWYDAGDHVKFGFPMAFTATRLAWSAIENPNAFKNTGQWTILLDNLRWVNNYFLKCHKRNANGSTQRFYGQVGLGSADHGWWGPAEIMPMARPSYFIDPTKPGSDLAGETAAAMAAASIVFKTDDLPYSDLLLDHAIALYTFAETYKAKYSASITDAANYYQSYSGFNDELVWGAIWLYKATGNTTYLTKARTYYNALPNETRETVKAYSWGDNWDNKAFASYVLMAMITGESQYRADAQRNLDFWTQGYNGKKVSYSPGGQAFLDQWGSLRYAANTSFLALLYGKHIQTIDPVRSTLYTNFGTRQMHYILGDNPNRRSYVIGFGNNPPANPHHRTSHSSWNGSINVPAINRHILYGALVGGPGRANDAYTDSRSDYQSNEVACDYNAGFTCAIAFLQEKFGGQALVNFPQPEPVPLCSEYICSGTSKGTSFKIRLQNRTGWPARKESNGCYRYYFGLDNGLSVSDYRATLSYTSRPGATVAIFPYGTTMGYVQVCYPGVDIIPGGSTSFYVESQIALGLRTGLSSSLFNYTNDWSYYRTAGQPLNTTAETRRIAVLSANQLVCGDLPLMSTSAAKQTEMGLSDASALSASAVIFPNPAARSITLQLNNPITDPVQFILLDLPGKVILQRALNFNGTDRMPVSIPSEISAGNYIWQLRTPKGAVLETGKISVMK
jgi:hypothetical protein